MNALPVDDFLIQEQPDFRQLLPGKEVLLRAMGYGKIPAPEFVHEELTGVLNSLEASGFDDICGGFRVFFSVSFGLRDNGFSLGDTFFKTGEIIAANLKDSEIAVFMITTAGNKITAAIERANRQQDLLQAYVLDVIGSELAEAVADHLQARLALECKKWGLGITHRYSPGYCGWDVAEQHKLFGFLPQRFCGVSLSSSALMSPLKSVSCIIGAGRNAVKRSYGCSICTLTTCYKRRKKK